VAEFQLGANALSGHEIAVRNDGYYHICKFRGYRGIAGRRRLPHKKTEARHTLAQCVSAGKIALILSAVDAT
jgi:hypothetical protein